MDLNALISQVSKHIDVDFNSLDLTVNLQTWVVVFEFFGIGAPPPPTSASTQQSPREISDFADDQDGKILGDLQTLTSQYNHIVVLQDADKLFFFPLMML